MAATDPVLYVFLAVVAAVVVLALWSLARLGFERFGTVQRPGAVGLRVRRTVFGLAGLGALCLAWGLWVEPRWPEVTHVTVPVAGLTPGQRVRIVHLSDFHAEASQPDLLARVAALVAAERPDAIVFTGDTLNDRDGLPLARSLLKQLAAVAPTYVVRGNWDTWYWPDLDLFGGLGVVEMDGKALPLADGALWLAGLDYGHDAQLPETLAQAPPGVPVVLLHHTPDIAEDAAARRVALVLAGHTHGGQVALPFYGAMVTFSRFGKRFESGLAYAGATAVYVNRGLGMEGGLAPRVRFCARPEVTVLDVVAR